jgi:hypothetical protein
VQWISKSGFEFEDFKFLYSVDRLAQSEMFDNFLEWN